MKLKLNKSERIRAIDLQQWHSITMRKPSNWSQRQKKNAQERLVRLTKDLEETVARNDARVQEAMTDKRAGLVEAIVERW